MNRKQKIFLVLAILAAAKAGAEIVEIKPRAKRRWRKPPALIRKRQSRRQKLVSKVSFGRK